jgi:hypothetical protein
MPGQQWPITPGVGMVSLATGILTPTQKIISPLFRTLFDKFLLTIQNISPILVLEQMFAFTEGGIK